MAFLTVSTIRAKVAEILGGVSALTGETVLVDDGRQKDQFEETLADRGIVVIVGPIMSLERQVDDPGIPLVKASFPVEFYENPERNPHAAAKNIFEVISASVLALIRWNPGNGEYQFEADQDLCGLIADSPGQRGYVCLFSKHVVLG